MYVHSIIFIKSYTHGLSEQTQSQAFIVHIHILDIFDCAILFANRIIIAVNTDRPELLLINLSPDGFYSFTKTVCEIIYHHHHHNHFTALLPGPPG